MSLESLQQKVEFTLKYSEGSLRKWKNRLSWRLREFYKSLTPTVEIYFHFYSTQGLIEVRRRPDFFLDHVFTFCLTHDQPYESMTGPIGQRLLT
jgi:hypothetical protein